MESWIDSFICFLVSATAYAGALDVSGAASITYHSSDDAAAGNAYANKAYTFSGGGDLDNGMTISYSYARTMLSAPTLLLH